VPSPAGGTVYDQWLKFQQENGGDDQSGAARSLGKTTDAPDEIKIGDLGSGSDFTPFFQHEGVPSNDIGSTGPYGVYHSVFDNYAWFVMNADPTFVYEQQQARVFGLEILHMADADVLPYDYRNYGTSVVTYVNQAEAQARKAHLTLDFGAAEAAAARFAAAGVAIRTRQLAGTGDIVALNHALRSAEQALLEPAGLPRRSWYKHTIYSPGIYTGYAAVVIPGVTEGIDAGDAARTQAQIAVLAAALNRSAAVLEAAAK